MATISRFLCLFGLVAVLSAYSANANGPFAFGIFNDGCLVAVQSWSPFPEYYRGPDPGFKWCVIDKERIITCNKLTEWKYRGGYGGGSVDGIPDTEMEPSVDSRYGCPRLPKTPLCWVVKGVSYGFGCNNFHPFSEPPAPVAPDFSDLVAKFKGGGGYVPPGTQLCEISFGGIYNCLLLQKFKTKLVTGYTRESGTAQEGVENPMSQNEWWKDYPRGTTIGASVPDSPWSPERKLDVKEEEFFGKLLPHIPTTYNNIWYYCFMFYGKPYACIPLDQPALVPILPKTSFTGLIVQNRLFGVYFSRSVPTSQGLAAALIFYVRWFKRGFSNLYGGSGLPVEFSDFKTVIDSV